MKAGSLHPEVFSRDIHNSEWTCPGGIPFPGVPDTAGRRSVARDAIRVRQEGRRESPIPAFQS
jgi:hypothetical protein